MGFETASREVSLTMGKTSWMGRAMPPTGAILRVAIPVEEIGPQSPGVGTSPRSGWRFGAQIHRQTDSITYYITEPAGFACTGLKGTRYDNWRQGPVPDGCEEEEPAWGLIGRTHLGTWR